MLAQYARSVPGALEDERRPEIGVVPEKTSTRRLRRVIGIGSTNLSPCST
jgi:hypothetical protein